MKKQAVVFIDIDLEQDGITGCSLRNDHEFMIAVRKDIIERNPDINVGKESVVAALSHELGHMLAVMFKMPGMMQDYRLADIKNVDELQIPLNPSEGVVASESEAWDLGFMMLEAAKLKASAMEGYTKDNNWLDTDGQKKLIAIQLQKQLMKELKQLLENRI